MTENLVVYYSNNGSNKFLAEQVATDLNCDKESIQPIINAHILLLMGMGIGIKRLKHRISDYKKVILIGPVWMGKFIFPLKQFVKKYKKDLDELVFLTCCGSSYEVKDEKYGHQAVFDYLKNSLPGKEVVCYALPITLLLSEKDKEDSQKVMETRLTQQNFVGEMREKYNHFLKSVSK